MNLLSEDDSVRPARQDQQPQRVVDDDARSGRAAMLLLTEEEERIAALYRKMLRMGLPNDIVRNRMVKEKVNSTIIHAVFDVAGAFDSGSQEVSPEQSALASASQTTTGAAEEVGAVEAFNAEQQEVDRLEEQKWEAEHAAENKQALVKLRRHMPVRIRYLSEDNLYNMPTPNGKFLPPAMVKRFKHQKTSILECLRIHPNELERMHPSTLELLGATGLTLTERRALYEHFKLVGPKWEENKNETRIGRKWAWYQKMRNDLKTSLATYQQHLDQYGPPENHPTILDHPNGCPLLGCDCPIKADCIVDYNGDYGFTEKAEYDHPGAPDSLLEEQVLETTKERKARERADLLRLHYGGKALPVWKANTSCEWMDELMDKMEDHTIQWIEFVIGKAGDRNMEKVDTKQEYVNYRELLKFLKWASVDVTRRAGIQTNDDKSKAAAVVPDIRSAVECGLAEEVYECAQELFKYIQERMSFIGEKDICIEETLAFLEDLFAELHKKNIETLHNLGVERPKRSRTLKTNQDLQMEAEQRCKQRGEDERDKQQASVTMARTGPALDDQERGGATTAAAVQRRRCGWTLGGGGLLVDTLAARGRGGRSGRGGLLETLAARGRTGRGPVQRGGLLDAAAVAGRGRGVTTTSVMSGRGSVPQGGLLGRGSVPRGGLLDAIAGRGRGVTSAVSGRVLEFNHWRFIASVDQALERVQSILDHTRCPVLCEDDVMNHQYDDKFALAEILTNTNIAAQLNVFERLGMTTDKLKKVASWVHEDKRSVTLRFQATDACSFLEERDVDSVAQEHRAQFTTTAATATLEESAATTQKAIEGKVIQRVKECHWNVSVHYTLVAFCGSEPHDAQVSVVLQTRRSATVLITSERQGNNNTSTKQGSPPMAALTVHPPIDINLTWFIQQLEPENFFCDFSIDRAQATCKTPRRNSAIQEAIDFQKSLYDWNGSVQRFFGERVEREILGQHRPQDGSRTNENSYSKPTPAARSGNPLDAGTVCVDVSNGKLVIVREILPDQDLYQVESVNTDSSRLAQTTLTDASDLRVESLPSHNVSSGPSLYTLTTESLFCPVLPLMEQGHVLSVGDVSNFLSEQVRSLNEAATDYCRIYPPRESENLISVAEAIFVLLTLYSQQLSALYTDSVGYIEEVLKKQLVQAIGKEVSIQDFDGFMNFHIHKLFLQSYAPRPFCYAIRRSPHHYPDGIITVETTRTALCTGDPVETFCRKISGASSLAGSNTISVPINASTCVEISGDKYVHGWLQHQFGNANEATARRSKFQLACRARQFSSFLVIVGTMTGATQLDPKHAIILQSKDEVLIPLLTNALATAKEFKDAIQSLSPEQRVFAQAFRGMQLASSVFAVAVIQLRPQLELLLGLPAGSLTKEIQLTQDLMSLFVKYQIPSDMLACEEAMTSGTTTPAKIAAVKCCVKSVMNVIELAQEKLHIEEERKAQMRAEARIAQMRAEADCYRQSIGYRMNEIGSARPEVAPASESWPPGWKGSCEEFAPDENSVGLQKILRATSAESAPTVPSFQKISSFPSPQHVAASIRQIESNVSPTTQGIINKEQTRVVAEIVSESLSVEIFTRIPKILDAQFEKFHAENSLRSIIIQPGTTWSRSRQENLLTPMQTQIMRPLEIEFEKKAAFDLLDAISRSGTLPIQCSELHVIVAVSHSFDNDIMGTIIQDNINPIEKVERSLLMVGSTILCEKPKNLLQNEHDAERLRTSFPLLFQDEP